jgi:hypothetical protein
MIGPATGASFGLGFGIRTDPESSAVPGSVGTFTWGGFWGTTFWIDPAEKLIAVQMIQVAPADNTGQFARALRFLTYAALRSPDPASFTPPAIPVTVDPDTLATYVGTYDFGASVSASDKQALGPAFAGLGIEIAMQDGVVRVRAPYQNGPAAKAGVIAGDVITQIDDTPIKGLSLNQVIGRLRGPADTQARLKIVHQGQGSPVDVAVVRKMMRTPGTQVKVRRDAGKLMIESTGPWPVLDFDIGKPVAVRAISDGEFYVDGGGHTRIAFVGDRSGKITGAVLNPGPREVKGVRLD